MAKKNHFDGLVYTNQKQEVKNELNTLDDIYKYSDLLLKTAEAHDKSKEVA